MLPHRITGTSATVFGRAHTMRVRRMRGARGLAVGLVLFGVGVPALGYGDHNGDGTIDLIDYAEFPACLAGPGEGLGTGCEVFDFDSDTDVDAFDFAAFQWLFGTPMPPGMVLVPAGEFEMGDPFDEGGADDTPVHDVYLSTYCIDTYEVTNQQYCEYLNSAYGQGLIEVSSDVVYKAGGSEPYCDTTTSSLWSRITWDGATFGVTTGKENHPMIVVSWYGAVAYCNWRSATEGRPLCYDLSTWTCDLGVAGYRLPTEAEWEKAAGWDPVQSRHFRFGEHTDGCGYDCLDGHRANYWVSGDPYESGSYPYTTPTGFYNGELHYKAGFGWPGSATSYQTQNAQSYYGCYDTSGNVWDWCNDWYDADYYDDYPAGSWPPNPTGPASGTYRVQRGGSWGHSLYACRSAARSFVMPGLRGNCYGFRCAMGL
jgi:formylglycine-generating enzyme required for sulfatase activity